jgi:energy-coupling factor transporter ATP-binding protein EcfA2
MGKVTHGIRSINIENFRGIDSLALNFEMPNGDVSDIVVVAGPNGCGKTTVLEACLLALNKTELVSGSVGPRAVRVGSLDYSITAEITAKSPTERQPFGTAYVTSTGYNRRSSGGEYQVVYIPSWRYPKLVGPQSLSAQGSRPPTDKVGLNGNLLPVLKRWLIDSKAHARMRDLTREEEEQTEYGQLIAALDRSWAAFYPPGHRFGVEPASADPNAGFDLYLTDPDGRRLQVDALSSGQLEIVMLVGTLFRRRHDIHVLVIDEPELHLDPQWHVPLLNVIRRMLPNTQVIVGTHSGRIYDSVFSFQRHFLVPDDDPRSAVWRRKRQEAEKGVVYES